jgi:uncharacterized lipoprotein YddW (UPF0748 family)
MIITLLRSFVLCVVVLFMGVTLVVVPAHAQSAGEGLAREVRGVWIPAPIHTTLWSSKASIAQQMDYLASRGFNVVFPVVWVGGYTLYPSEVMRERFGVAMHPDIGQARRHMLAELIVEARRIGMEVIPWFEYGFATHYGDSGGHILQRKPEWAARDRHGNFAIQHRDASTGTGFTWMNGINPEVHDFMLDLIRELLETYDVDGVQGDDRLPAMPAIAGYDDYTVELYEQEHGGQPPPQNPYDAAFMQWKADKLSNFGGRLYDMVKEIDPHLTVSLSPSIYPFSFNQYLQDWPEWLDRDQVDLIHPQAYRWTIDGYKNLIREMVGSVPGSTAGHVRPEHRHKLSPGIVALVGSQVNPPSYLVEAVRFNREYGIAGEVFFFNEGLGPRNAFAADSLYAYHYHTPAILPNRDGIRRPPPVLLRLDDEAVERTGAWQADPNVQGFDGPMLVATKGTGSRLIYRIDVPYPGYYDVYAFQPHNVFATRTAHYTLTSGTDEIVTIVDQLGTATTGWTHVGTMPFDPWAGGTLVLDADAVTDPDERLHRTYGEAVMVLLNRKLTPYLLITSAEDEPEPGVAVAPVRLDQNYPNPFSNSTAIHFTLAQPGSVSLHVYDTLGRRVASLIEGVAYPAGGHQVSAELGHLASGVYVYRIETPSASHARLMVITR